MGGRDNSFVLLVLHHLFSAVKEDLEKIMDNEKIKQEKNARTNINLHHRSISHSGDVAKLVIVISNLLQNPPHDLP